MSTKLSSSKIAKGIAILVGWVILTLVVLSVKVGNAPLRNYLEFSAASLQLDNRPYSLIAGCDKFFSSKEDAQKALEEVTNILKQDQELKTLIEQEQVLIGIMQTPSNHRADCKNNIAISVSYPTHELKEKIENILEQKGLLDKYVINLSNF